VPVLANIAIDLKALEILFHDEVHYAGDGIGTVGRDAPPVTTSTRSTIRGNLIEIGRG